MKLISYGFKANLKSGKFVIGMDDSLAQNPPVQYSKTPVHDPLPGEALIRASPATRLATRSYRYRALYCPCLDTGLLELAGKLGVGKWQMGIAPSAWCQMDRLPLASA